jgi:hypothetical protein
MVSDTNKDGLISLQEFLNLMRKCFTGTLSDKKPRLKSNKSHSSNKKSHSVSRSPEQLFSRNNEKNLF